MQNLYKNIFRYLFKNKFITLSLSFFIFLIITILSLFTGISNTMQNSYDSLVTEYNLHNIVIYDNWSNNLGDSQQKQDEFYSQLNDLGVYYRQYKSINVYSSTTQDTTKIIKYENDYTVDQLDVFEQYGLPLNSNNHYSLPSGFDFESIIENASVKDENGIFLTNYDNIFARQLLVYFLANASWSGTNNFEKPFDDVLNYMYDTNNNFDPLNPTSTDLNTTFRNSITKVQGYINSFLDSNNTNYQIPLIKGSRITFGFQKLNNNIPLYANFDDPSSNLAIVSPNWLHTNNKEVLPFSEFINQIGYSNNLSYNPNPTKINQLPKNMSSDLSGWINNLDDKYKVYANSIPYIIVGSGITPDMMFPIVSFDLIVPNPTSEAIVYTNNSGYERANFSFQSMYHESYILSKYNGKLSQSEILTKIKNLVSQYMSWPSNINAVYWYNDSSNTMSPVTSRVIFITQLLDTINGVTYALSLFILILLLIALCLFTTKYISNNKNIIAILISNGISKLKIISSMSLISVLISVFSIPLGYFLGLGLQPLLYHTVFEQYWLIPIKFNFFDPNLFFPILIVPTVIFILIIFIFAAYLLRKNVIQLLKEDQNIVLSKTTLFFRSLFNFAPIMTKFRGSIAFNSVSKILFLTLTTTILAVSFSFITSSANQISTAYQYELNTNKSAYSLELLTPTVQGGQYYGVNTNKAGQSLIGSNDSLVAQIDYSSSSNYKNAWNNLPLFHDYSLMHWSSSESSSAYTKNIIYLKNLVQIFPILDIQFGTGSLGSNPFEIMLNIAPVNQINALYNSMVELATRLMSDMRPYDQSYLFKFTSSKTGYITPSASNSFNFPQTWAIMNIDENDPSNWALNYNNDANVGVLSAPEINGLNSLTIDQIASLDPNELVKIINDAYNTYNSATSTELINLPNTDQQKFDIKYYPNLFDNNTISNIRIENNCVLFDVDTTLNTTKYLMTPRSLFIKLFYKSVDISNLSQDAIINQINTAQYFADPFSIKDNNLLNYTYYQKNTSNMTQGLLSIPMRMSINYINYVLRMYRDPAYQSLYFRCLYNQILFDQDTDEPYVYINGINNNNNIVKITGIVENSKFINLYDNKNHLINNLLFDTSIDNPLIINNYAAEYFDLNVGDKITISVQNSVYRCSLETNSVINYLEGVSDQIKYDTSNIHDVIYTVVGINNTGKDVQMFTNINSAQNALGLSTQSNYENNENLIMNNHYNSFGGFNGIFTSNYNNLLLYQTLSLYSLSGLYPAIDSWEESATLLSLLKNTLNDSNEINYIANAFSISVDDLTRIWNNNKTDNFINKIRNLYINVYGLSSLNAIFENANSVEMSKIMFDKMSLLYDQISTIVVTLLMVLSLISTLLCSTMLINDMNKLIAVLKTLGYDDKENAKNIVAAFIPIWLLSLMISGPITYFAVTLFKKFIFVNLLLYLSISVNWLSFFVIQLIIGVIFSGIYLYSLQYFKKKNILDTIKW